MNMNVYHSMTFGHADTQVVFLLLIRESQEIVVKPIEKSEY